jgi:RNA polymerase sigma-70 factor (ECF subfamily)
MLGSVVDAEDAVQDTMLRRGRGLAGFDERASLKTWLYRIATNVCLDALAAGRRRLRPVDLSDTPATVGDDLVLTQRPREHWVEPIPDAAALPAVEPATPRSGRSCARASGSPSWPRCSSSARQRAALLLTQVLDGRPRRRRRGSA